MIDLLLTRLCSFNALFPTHRFHAGFNNVKGSLQRILIKEFFLFYRISGDIQELFETSLKPGHAAAFSEDCDSASSKGIIRGAGNQVGLFN